MARRVFFSFHFERDIWRVGQVRNCWLTKPDRESAGYWDVAKWEEVKKQGDDAIKRWIKNQMLGASVTVVLIGSETANREWVRFEIIESYNENMGILGIYIHKKRDINGYIASKGDNPFDRVYLQQTDGSKKHFSSIYPTYDWVENDGYNNMGGWIENAARKAGR